MLRDSSLFRILFLAMVFLLPNTSAANSANLSRGNNIAFKDYGVRGHLFEIAEASILEDIMQKLKEAEASGALDALQAKFTAKVKAKVLRPNPVAGVGKARVNRSWTYDPTYTQDETITDGNGRVIVEAGTTVNALEKMSWGETMIFIDGDDKEQVQWAKEQRGKIVLTKGMPLELSKILKRAVYFDQGGILCHRFRIEATPATIDQEGTLLRVREVKL